MFHTQVVEVVKQTHQVMQVEQEELVVVEQELLI
tara:strand:- start:165 stop:266 length:102 start_codon:yes stop_codon:yes gene_type:complete